MKVKNDDRKLLLTNPFIEALKNLMKEHILMMRIREPEWRECWVIGACKITDMSASNGINFHFGDLECKKHLIKGSVCWVEVEL